MLARHIGAGALPLCADGFTWGPPNRTAAESTTPVSVRGIVQNPGQEITIRGFHRDTGNYTALDTPPASTRGLTAKWHKGIQMGNGAFSRTGVMVVAV